MNTKAVLRHVPESMDSICIVDARFLCSGNEGKESL